jgi:hypothetical protein
MNRCRALNFVVLIGLALGGVACKREEPKATSKNNIDRSAKAIPAERPAERTRIDAFYSTRELECAKKSGEAAFLSANGRDARVPDRDAKACYAEVADYREAMSHLDDMFAPIDGTSYRLGFEMNAVNAEIDLGLFLDVRRGIDAIGRARSESGTSSAAVFQASSWLKSALARSEKAEKSGVVIDLPAGTVVSGIAYHYTKKDLIFSMTANGKQVFMPYWLVP